MRLGDSTDPRADDRVPRLVDDLDPTAMALSPDEGFLLSRIDGATPCRTLRQIGGLPAVEVDRCLERWLAEGVITFGTDAPALPANGPGASPADGPGASPASGPGASPASGPGAASPAAEGAPEIEVTAPEPTLALDLPGIDPSLDLAEDVQKRVLEMVLRLERPYHEILDVALEADTREVKKAYFKLSKVFHPDRYFRRNLGDYEALVERCFKRILEAYELLSDPMTRKEVQAQARAAEREERLQKGALASEAALAARRDPARMRRRLDQLTGQGRFRAERRRKAKGFFEAGVTAFGAGRWLEAAGSVRLAIAFDPKNEAYRERFVEVQRQAHQELAQAAVKKAEAALELRDYPEALAHFEEAVHYRPADADLHMRAARVAWQGVGELRKAKELAGAAVDLAPEVAAHHRTLGQVYAAAGLEANARRELRIALEMEPGDAEAKRALRSL